MFKPKSIVVSAGGAFILSFFISIIATHKFFSALGRGVFYGVIFAVLAAVISFLNEKFLSEETGFSEYSEENGTSPRQTSGGLVDIVVDDENLTDDSDGPAFSIEQNKHSLREKDVSPLTKNESKPESSASEKNQMPLRSESTDRVLLENNDSGNQSELKSQGTQIPETSDFKAVSLENMNSVPERLSEKNAERAAQMKEIDSLPDISDFREESTSTGEVVEDSDFAEFGSEEQVERVSVVDGGNASNHDTETIAKAIRTILKKDD